MATAEQMRQLHPDPPTRHDDYHRAIVKAILWRLEYADHQKVERGEPISPHITADLTPGTLLATADGIIAALLRYGTPGDPS